jgi:Putative sterol carrier protein
MTMQDTIQEMIDKFHRKMESDEKVRKEVEPIYKRLNIDLKTESYSMILDHGEINEFKDELLDEADITLISTPEHMQALIDGTLRPMKAYLTGKIKVKGKLEDVMHLRKLF